MSQTIKVSFQWISIGAMITLAGFLFHAGMRVQAVESGVTDHTTAIAEIRETIKSIPVIETDIKWIRHALERQEQNERK